MPEAAATPAQGVQRNDRAGEHPGHAVAAESDLTDLSDAMDVDGDGVVTTDELWKATVDSNEIVDLFEIPEAHRSMAKAVLRTYAKGADLSLGYTGKGGACTGMPVYRFTGLPTTYTLEGPFSVVSKPICATEGSICSSRRLAHFGWTCGKFRYENITYRYTGSRNTAVHRYEKYRYTGT